MGMMDGWEKRLAAVCEEWRHREFAWGQSDCLHFCIACEHAVRGWSNLDHFPNYRTELGGMRHMRGLGFRTIPGLLDSLYERVPVRTARRGYWVMADQGGQLAFGVVVGRNVAVMSESGLQFYPVEKGTSAWRVS